MLPLEVARTGRKKCSGGCYLRIRTKLLSSEFTSQVGRHDLLPILRHKFLRSSCEKGRRAHPNAL